MAYTAQDIAKRRADKKRGSDNKFDTFRGQGPSNTAPVRSIDTNETEAPVSTSSKISGGYTTDMIKKRREERQHGRQDTFAYQAQDYSGLPAPSSTRQLLSALTRQTMPYAYPKQVDPVQTAMAASLGQYGKGNIDLTKRPQYRQQEAYYDDSPLRSLAHQAPRPFELGQAVQRFQQTGEMNISPELKKMMDEAPEDLPGQGISSSEGKDVEILQGEPKNLTREGQWAARHPYAGTAMYGVANVVGGGEGIVNTAEAALRALATGQKMDPNAIKSAPLAQAYRTGAAEGFREGLQRGVTAPIAQAAGIDSSDGRYSGGEKAMDFLSGVAADTLSSGMGMATGGMASTYLMGANAANQSLYETATDENTTARQALALGVANGVAEAFFEHFSIENLMSYSAPTSVKQFVGNYLKQSGVEASEEIATEIANTISDFLIRGENSEAGREYQSYIAQGMDPNEAARLTMGSVVKQVALAGLGGFLSGGLHTAGQSAFSLAQGGSQLRSDVQKGNMSLEELAEGIDTSTTEGQKVQKMAMDLATKQKAGQDISTAEYGFLNNAVENAMESSEREVEPLADVYAKAEAEENRAADLSKTFGEEGRKAFMDIPADQAADSYKDFAAYYNHLRFGAPIQDDIKTNLTTEQIQSAMNAGAADANRAYPPEAVKVAGKAVSRIQVDGVNAGRADTSGVNYNNLTPQQKLRVDYASAFITKGLGLDVRFVQSNAVDGRYQGMNGSFQMIGDRPTITLDVNAGMNMESDWTGDLTDIKTMLPVISHEVTHYLEKAQPALYKSISDAVMASLANNKSYTNGMTINQLIRAEIDRMNRTERDANGNPIAHTEADAIHEIVARACEDMLSGNKEATKIFDDLDVETKKTLWDHVKEVFDNIREFFSQMLSSYASNSDEAKAIRQNMKEFERIRNMWQEALNGDTEIVPASDLAVENTAFDESTQGQFSVRQFAQALDLDVDLRTEKIYDPKTGKEIKRVTEKMMVQTPMGAMVQAALDAGTIDAGTAQKQLKMFKDLMNLTIKYSGSEEMVWQIAGTYLFSSVKTNSDKQYSTTVDYGTICSKTQALIDVLSKTMVEKGRGLTREEVLTAYNKTAGVGLSVPCPVCYVFSRWMGVPSLLETMRKCQVRFGNASEAEIQSYISSMLKEYETPKGVNEAKTKVQNRLATLERKLQEALDKNDLTAQAEVRREVKELEKKMSDLESFNWVTQVRCVKGKDGKYKLDPQYKKTGDVPIEILLDLTRSGDFAQQYPKAWKYRTTRGAGMGKAIMPYSGAALGDFIKGNKDRWAEGKNPFFKKDAQAAKAAINRALKRARAQNLIGGQRFQSTSDFRAEWGIDYLMTFLECQAAGSQVQLYTKVIEAVDMFASAGAEVNLSIMPKGDGHENGKLVFSDVTGVNFDDAYKKTRLYDNVQMILVGINDEHIRLAMKDDRISFIIPWHPSGNSKETLANLMQSVGETLSNATSYEDSQNDKVIDNSEEKKALRQFRKEIIQGKLWENYSKRKAKALTAKQQEMLDGNQYLKELYRKFYQDTSAKEYAVQLNGSQASGIFPYEYWDTSLTVKDADQNGRRFQEYCASLGIQPRFSQFADDTGYWKLLIDRRMYNRNGTYHDPSAIDVTNVKVKQIPQAVNSNNYKDTSKINQATMDTIRALDDQQSDLVPAEDRPQMSMRDSSGRDTTFYSKLQREIQNFKGEKIGASSVESYLKGKGVKDEEIKWSGIRTFLEGKKSVSKAELMDYLKANELEIEETTLTGATDFADSSSGRRFKSIRDIDNYIENELGYKDYSAYYENYTDQYVVWINDGSDDGIDMYFDKGEGGTQWSEYTLDGGDNYREILFRMPNSDYTNSAMSTHWGNTEDGLGVLSHARIQDFSTDNGENVLFIEEIQSDWHNEGQKKGYATAAERKEGNRALKRSFEIPERAEKTFSGYNWYDLLDLRRDGKLEGTLGKEKAEKFKEIYKEYEETTNKGKSADMALDAPFRTTYTDFVLKNLLRMAAEGDYDYLAWTTGKMQEERWSDEYAEGYRIEYDQQIPKFLKKYGKQWGAGLTEVTVGGNTVPAIVVNDAMKESVLTEGQPMFSMRGADRSEMLDAMKERQNSDYIDRIAEITAEKDAEIERLKAKMEKAVGAEKQKAKDRIEKIRKEKNSRIAYLEKSYKANLDWRIAEMNQKLEKAGGKNTELKQKLKDLREQKNQKIEEILQKNREQRLKRREKRAMQELLRRARRLMSESKKGTPEFRAQVDALIGDLDLAAAGIRDNTRAKLEELRQQVETQSKLDPDYAKYEAPKYADLLSRIDPSRRHISEMSIDEITRLTEAIIALEHSKQTADREIKEGQGRLFGHYGKQAVEQQKNVKGINYRNELGAQLGKYRLNMLAPVRAFALIDGYQKDGVFTYFGNQLNDGQTKAAQFRMEVEKMFQDIDNNPKLINDFAKQDIEIDTLEGKKKISKGMRIALYLHLQNMDNVKHIAFGGITIPNENLYRKGKYKEAYAAGETVHLSEWIPGALGESALSEANRKNDAAAAAAIRKITDQMTPEEMEYARIAYDFFNEKTKNAINEVSMELNGYEKAIVDDYFPIHTNKSYLASNYDGLMQDGTLEGMGMLKERQNSRLPIYLEDVSQVVLRQKNNTALYYGLAVPIRNFTRFYNYTGGERLERSVKAAIGKTWNQAGLDYIDHVLNDLQFGRQTERSIVDTFKGIYAGTTLNLNLGVAIKQSASYPFAASVIGWGPLAKAAKSIFTKADRDYMDSITPWGYMRRQGFSGTEMGEVAKQRTGIDNNQQIQKAKRVLNLIQNVDVKTTEVLFAACEEYVKEKNPGIEVRGKEYNRKLAEIYTEVLQRTQPSYDVMQRNEFLRSKNDLAKILGMFKTQTFNMGGELIDSWARWRAYSEYAKNGDGSYTKLAEDAGKAFKNTVAATMASQMMLTVLSAAANALLHKMKPYRDDKGEVTAESIAKKLVKDFAGSFAGMTLGGSEIQSFAAALFGDEKWYDIEYPGLNVINDIFSSSVDLSKALKKALDTGDKGDMMKASQKFGTVLMSGFKLKGIPAQNVYNIANLFYLWGQDIKNGNPGSFEAGDGLFGWTDTSPTRDQYANMAVDAARKGDMAKAERALKNTKKTNLEKAVGRPITETMYKRIMDDPSALRSYLGVALEDMKPSLSDVPSWGFSSFTRLKEGLGNASRNENLHHIVEQEQGPGENNLSTFKATEIQNANNVISIPSGASSVHEAISNHYKSVQDYTDGKTVRQWLHDTKSFEEQFDYGIEQLRQYGDVVPTKKGWVFIPDEEKITRLIPEKSKPEITDVGKEWGTRISEMREDGGVTRHEAGTVALEMLADGASSDEIKEYYQKNQGSDKKLSQWKGSFEDYLEGRNAVDEAKAIKDNDKKRQAEKREKYITDYLIKYHGDDNDELMLWRLMYKKSPFPKEAKR